MIDIRGAASKERGFLGAGRVRSNYWIALRQADFDPTKAHESAVPSKLSFIFWCRRLSGPKKFL
jgi:hypothetical protein